MPIFDAGSFEYDATAAKFEIKKNTKVASNTYLASSGTVRFFLARALYLRETFPIQNVVGLLDYLVKNSSNVDLIAYPSRRMRVVSSIPQ